VLPSALVPGSRVKSTGTPRQSRLSLPYIGGAPGGRWVSQQRHSFQPSAAGERRTKARRALGPAARGRIAGDISLRAAESVVESPAQLPLHASSHAANRHPAPSTQHPAPSTHRSGHRLRRGKGRRLHRSAAAPGTHPLRLRLSSASVSVSSSSSAAPYACSASYENTHTYATAAMRVMAGFDGPHAAHGQAHVGHYGVPAQSHYAAMAHHSGLSFARPLPMGAPVLAPAGFNHPQHTGHHQHGRIHHQIQNQGQHLHHAQRSQNHTHNHNHHPHLAMADSAYMASAEQLAHLQKLSSEYEPEASVSLLPCTAPARADRPQGPLVGERQSSAAITAQYASADPVFRAKTLALPTKYAYYRSCRGDGHCGWRGECIAPSVCLASVY
jgi:hypothetical protein